MCGAQRPQGRGEVGQTPGIAAVPRGRATFRGALPGVARPSGNEGAGVARGAPGGGAVAAVALSRGRAEKNRKFCFSAT